MSSVWKELTDGDILCLRENVRPFYTEKRYRHALAVEEEVGFMGQILLPHRINALRAAALLHDITKKFDLEKQLQCCADFGIILETPCSPEVLHARTGAVEAAKHFPAYVDDEILQAIRRHTTGQWGMSKFDSILFLADYIEPTRTHPACMALRQTLHGGLASASDGREGERVLDSCVLSALDNTIGYLLEKRAVIDPDTIQARNYYLSEKDM